MKNFIVANALCATVAVGYLGITAAHAQESVRRPNKEIEALVRRLGSEKFRDREEAKRQLLQTIGVRAFLRKALRASDLEVARRAQIILAELDKRQVQKLPARLKHFAKMGKLDLVMYLAYHWPEGREEKACFETLWALVKTIAEIDHKQGGRALKSLKKSLPKGEPESYLSKVQFFRGKRLGIDFIKPDTPAAPFLFRVEQVETPSTPYPGGVILCEGRCRVGSGDICPVFSLGSIEATVCEGAILLCDGDVRLISAGAVLVIARGKVTIDEHLFSGRVFGGAVCFADKEQIVNSTVRVTKKPLPGFGEMFFEIKDAGLELIEEQAGLRTRSIEKTGPFAQAGVQPGDVILKLDGEPVSKAEDFRRRLRARVAFGEAVLVTVTRSGKALDLLIDLEILGE